MNFQTHSPGHLTSFLSEMRERSVIAVSKRGPIHGDCIDRVTVQNGARVFFERLQTPCTVGDVEKELAMPAAAATAAAAFHF